MCLHSRVPKRRHPVLIPKGTSDFRDHATEYVASGILHLSRNASGRPSGARQRHDVKQPSHSVVGDLAIKNTKVVVIVAGALVAFLALLAWGASLKPECQGSCTHPLVRITSVSCVNSTGTCTLQLENVGNGNGNAIDCSMDGAFANLKPNPATIQAGTSSEVSCANSNGHGAGLGVANAGNVLISDGETIPWSGMWR